LRTERGPKSIETPNLGKIPKKTSVRREKEGSSVMGACTLGTQRGSKFPLTREREGRKKKWLKGFFIWRESQKVVEDPEKKGGEKNVSPPQKTSGSKGKN